MKTKSQKKKDLRKLEEKIPKSDITIFTTFARAGSKGLSVAQTRELKRALREVGSEYLVSKKTLIERALKDIGYDGVDVYKMDGSLGMVVGRGDGYAIAKKAYEFTKKNQALQFFGAWFQGAFMDKERFLEMAKLPSRETILAQLFGMMKYPISAMAMALSQIAKQRESAVQS